MRQGHQYKFQSEILSQGVRYLVTSIFFKGSFPVNYSRPINMKFKGLNFFYRILSFELLKANKYEI